MMKIAGLAHVVAETTDLYRWKKYAGGVLGMTTTASPDGSLYVRMDERQFRFAIQAGASDANTQTMKSHSDFLFGHHH
jgi:3,4-dihydroxy-9,10-secoandrosta-1,3,5(10)-triene-9,17-dione 4,5-dioxygenase